MNIIKTLENQIAVGNNIILENGNIVPDEKVKGEALKAFLAGIKEGKIPFDKSFTDYYSESKTKFLTVGEVIAFIKDVDEYIPDAPEIADDDQENNTDVDQDVETEPESEKKPTKPTRRTRK